MKSLLIVRHAIALDREEAAARGIPDRERALTSKGKTRMQAIAQRLTALLPEPATLLHSPLLRTRQTAAILAAQWPLSAQECRVLAPGGEATALLREVARHPGPLVLVGHEPDLSEFIGLLLCGQPRSLLRLKKGGAALLHLEEPIHPGKAELQWQLNPKQLLTKN